MQNLFTDEKHYLTLNNYLRSIYHEKVFKISLNGNFSCPNRDGTISTKGCLFCSSQASGDFAGKRDDSIKKQFNQIKQIIEQKWPNGSYIAYFQANSNTYGTVDELKQRFSQIIDNGKKINDKIKILSIATRPDCFSEEIYQYLEELSKQITLWIELGFQTSNEQTAAYINRGYNNHILIETVSRLKKLNINVIVHIINGLPGDSKNDMLNTINFLNHLNIDGIKIHMLHIIKDSPLGIIYQKAPFTLLSLEEYVDITVTQLRMLNPKIVIHRITGDADQNQLIAPLWTTKKFVVMNEIDKVMRKNNYFQGDLYVKNR